jgi:outer membrane protein, multidrug efflux system
MSPRLVAVLAASAMIGGCAGLAAGPQAVPAIPGYTAPAAFSDAPKQTALNAADGWWREATQDPRFIALMERAGRVDDVVLARARLKEAQALLRAAQAGLLPALSTSARANRASADPGGSSTGSTFGLEAFAPIDLSGAGRARSSAAAARTLQAQAAVDAARLGARRLTGQLYAALRGAQTAKAAAERQAFAAADSLSLVQNRNAAGLENGLAVAQAKTAADAARARIPAFAQAEISARLGLEALLGLAPGALQADLGADRPPQIDAAGLIDAPLAVLARRPDLRAAEAGLLAADLDARAAQRDRWPSLTLSALAQGVTLTGAPDITSTGAAVSIAATLFDFGRLEALASAAGARAEAAAVRYRQTAVAAVAEVEREASRLRQSLAEAEALRAAARSAMDQAQLARARYTSGLTPFTDVLLAERALADAEIALAAAEANAADAGVGLATALGLGALSEG